MIECNPFRQNEKEFLMETFGKVMASLIVAIVALNILPFFGISSWYWGEYVQLLVMLIVFISIYWMLRGKSQDMQNVGLTPRWWLILLTVLFLGASFTADLYVQDGTVLSLMIIALIVFWSYSLKQLGGVSLWQIMRRKAPIVAVMAAVYLAIGGSYTAYRWSKFVPVYITKYDERETRLKAYHLKEKMTVSPADLRKEVESYVGAYPVSTNYKAMNMRWFGLWWTSAPAYFFTNIIRDFFDWVWSHLSGMLDSLTREQLKGWKNANPEVSK